MSGGNKIPSFSVPRCTVIVMIGRASEGCTLTDHAWRNFKGEVFDAIRSVGGDVIQRPYLALPVPADLGDQIGEWNGQQENAATFAGFVPAHMLEGLRSNLRSIKRGYGQEAIGFIAVPGTEHCV